GRGRAREAHLAGDLEHSQERLVPSGRLAARRRRAIRLGPHLAPERADLEIAHVMEKPDPPVADLEEPDFTRVIEFDERVELAVRERDVAALEGAARLPHAHRLVLEDPERPICHRDRSTEKTRS